MQLKLSVDWFGPTVQPQCTAFASIYQNNNFHKKYILCGVYRLYVL